MSFPSSPLPLHRWQPHRHALDLGLPLNLGPQIGQETGPLLAGFLQAFGLESSDPEKMRGWGWER